MDHPMGVYRPDMGAGTLQRATQPTRLGECYVQYPSPTPYTAEERLAMLDVTLQRIEQMLTTALVPTPLRDPEASMVNRVMRGVPR